MHMIVPVTSSNICHHEQSLNSLKMTPPQMMLLIITELWQMGTTSSWLQYLKPWFMVYSCPTIVKPHITRQVYKRGCVRQETKDSPFTISATPLMNEVVIPERRPEAQGNRISGTLRWDFLNRGQIFQISLSSRLKILSIN